MIKKNLEDRGILTVSGGANWSKAVSGEGIDLLPANIELSGLEVTLVNTMSRETILREYLNSVREQYNVILPDCCPSLGILTINALAMF